MVNYSLGESMIYKCMRRDCGFLFSRSSEVDACPDCGGSRIREATQEEQEEYSRLLKERDRKRAGQ